ncbi:MAG TPA: dockerin type I domain-containing protein [Dehalococcoidia bacterium]|nr:dockerin type I domain-containing protein [Dehalococcoidia bacterium]
MARQFAERSAWAPALLLVMATLVMLLPGGVRVSRAAQEASLQGDVNCDTAVNAVDSLQVLRSVAGLSTSAACLANAGDTNCDSAINAIDALRVLRYVAGLTNTTPEGCATIGEPLEPPATSYQLIDHAVDDGAVDFETGLIYKFYASFGDARLPAQYRGNDAGVFENPAILELPGLWDTLKQETREALAPFLKTPPEAGSWFEQQGAPLGAAGAAEWVSVDAPTIPVKLWYHSSHPQDAQNAQAYIAALEGTIWPSLVNYMGRQPLPDCGAACPSGGGDARLDIYLVDEGIRSMVVPQPDTCGAAPVFMILARDRSNAVLAHEFMHTIQFAFNSAGSCNEYHWFQEATAQWAMDYVYPGAPNEEQAVAPDLLDRPDLPLDERQDPHWYGAYLFPFYLTRIKGQTNAVRAIWDRSESTASSLVAINDTVPGGFQGSWPDFALKNWNRGPVDDYKDVDGLAAGARPDGGDPITLSSGGQTLGREMQRLSAVYYHFLFTDEAKSVVFKANRLSEISGIKVWAIRKTGAGWQAPEDWTATNSKSFCRDQTDISEVVIIISNSDWQGGLKDIRDKSPLIEAKDVGCTAWLGSASAEVNYYGRVFSVNVSGLRFTLNPGQDEQGRYVAYTLTESPAVTWHASGSGLGCAASGEMHLEPADGTVEMPRVNGSLVLDREENDYNAFITGYNPDAILILTCGGSPSQNAWPSNPILKMVYPYPKIKEGPVLDAEYVDPSEIYGGRWTWHFEPAP